MATLRESLPPQESEELRRFLSEATKENRDRKTLLECLPTLQVQSLADMKIHEQMCGSPVDDASWRGSYIRGLHSDTDSNYDQDETSPFDHDSDDGSPITSTISRLYIPDQLRTTKAIFSNSESSNSVPSPRLYPRILDLDESVSINEAQPTRPSPQTRFYVKSKAFSSFPKHYTTDPNIDHDRDNPLENLPSDESSEISALKFRIVELEYVNAALEAKVRQYREEIRLFKKDVKGYKNDSRRFTQQLNDKNHEITELHTKIIQLLNNDTLASPQTVASNSSGFSTRLSTANAKATAKQRKGSKASDELRNRSRTSRTTGHGNESHLKDSFMNWV